MYRCASISPSFLYPISLHVYLGRRLRIFEGFLDIFVIFEGFDTSIYGRQIRGTSHSANVWEYTKFLFTLLKQCRSTDFPGHRHTTDTTPRSLRVRRGVKVCAIRNSSFGLRKRNAAILERLKLCALGETLATIWACAKNLCVISPRG